MKAVENINTIIRDTITGSCRDGENLGRQLALRMKRGSKDDR